MRGSARSTSLRKVSTETRLRRTMPGSQGRRPPNSICSPKISTGVPTIPAIPGGAGTQFGRLNRIRTKPKARSPKASTISPMETVSPLALSTTCRSTAEALPWPAPAAPRSAPRPASPSPRCPPSSLYRNRRASPRRPRTWGANVANQGFGVQSQKRGQDFSSCGPRRRAAMRRARPGRRRSRRRCRRGCLRPRAGSMRAPGVFCEEAADRLLLVHAEDGIVVAAHAGIGHDRRCRRAGSAGRRSARGYGCRRRGWRGRRDDRPNACFSLVASAWKSTTTASAASPSGQASSSRSTTAKGSSSASMNTRPMTLTTSTRAPLRVSTRAAPRPGVPGG